MQRAKENENAVDNCTFTISTDWKSISAAGAQAAIGNAIAIAGAGNPNSSFSFGCIRPFSQYIADGDDAGNAAGVGSSRNMAQFRPGVGLRKPAALSSIERVSRVSFATDTRTSRVSFAW